MNLTGHVHIAERDALLDHLASALITTAIRAVDQRGVFHLALSGGSTPEPFYIRLVIDPRYRILPWDQTHLWLVDERRVPETDERSNFRMIRETLVDHVPLRRRRIHPMPVLADDPATEYEATLQAHIEDLRLDFVLLGMGDDAHTASLFPHSAAVRERRRSVAVNDGPNVTPPSRLTMTFPLLNGARELAVLVTGSQKQATLSRIETQLRDAGPDPIQLPITGIDPVDGELTWYLDHAAARGNPDICIP